ncbi:MAG: sugar ABC transporter ATP-binding protein [Phycisphaerae bacterium]
MSDPILRFEGVTKRFPGVTALAEVSFDVRRGECHAIMGENGAGKSTLGKILAGIYCADAGRVLLDGAPVRFCTPLDAARAGVAIVHQELAFCPNLSIAENLFLGRTPTAGGFVRWRDLLDHARELLVPVGLNVDPRTPIGRLSTGQEQLVQIAVAIGRRARIVIMDEPTSSLAAAESERLFGILGKLRAEGVTVLYVSHRIEEITRLCDRITVLRDGRFVGTLDTADTNADEIVHLMIGRPLAEYLPEHLRTPAGPTRLRVEGLTSRGWFENVSFAVRAGEVVGLAGLVGAGRSEVARTIFGVDRLTRGTVYLNDRPVSIRTPQDAIARGVGLLPEDRKRQALVLTMTCRENLSLSMLSRLRRWLFVDRRREAALADEYFQKLRVRAPGIDAGIAGLSGGNQQKIALAKWLAQRCQVLMLDEPTRGIDVGAKAEIHQLIDQLAIDGHAILLISSELPELLHLSTRILVLRNGRLVGEVLREHATQDVLMRMMANVSAA